MLALKYLSNKLKINGMYIYSNSFIKNGFLAVSLHKFFDCKQIFAINCKL